VTEADNADSGATVEIVALGARGTGSELDRRRLREQLPGLEPDRNVTDWGRSQRLARLADATVLRFLFHYWHRVEVEGLEHVPAADAALLVANHAGQLPLDGAMIAKAVGEDPRLRRVVHLASSRTFATVPVLGMAVTKLGGVSAHPANLHRLLFDEQALVLLFPEGGRARKPLRWRYRLRRFDQLEFVQVAIRARVPIIPVAVVGSEEAVPTLASMPLGVRLPLSAGVPLPAKLRLRFLEPVRTDDLAEALARDRTLAGELAEDIRGLIQENLFEMVSARRSVWLG
jgi:1-acyl-sn-glycerol-3-phosphate acyltransferase